MLPPLPTDMRMPRTDPSPKTAMKMPGWADPNPGSQYQSDPFALFVQSIRGHWLSGMGGIQFPASRMFGQSALCAQPGSSHQSHTFGWYCRAATAFSPIAIVFDVPSVTIVTRTVGYFLCCPLSW